MNTPDILDTLKAGNPVPDGQLADRLDRDALTTLRDGVMLTDRHQVPTVEPPRRRRRLAHRGVAVGGLALALVGSSAAYAAYTQWYGGGSSDGLTCMSTWQDPLTTDGPLDSTGGPPLTGDPVADCQRYQQLSGRLPISDPVAFSRSGMLFVTPRDQVPADGQVLTGGHDPDTSAAVRLEAEVTDLVDGGGSRCFTATDALPYMQAQIARLGLQGWTATVGPDNRPYEDGPCGFFAVDRQTHTVMFLPDRREDPNVRPDDASMAASVYDVRDALRASIAEQCVSAAEAEQVVAKAVGAQHHWPTTVVTDDQLPCATVDMAVGGSIQIWVSGPTRATGRG